jgi:hypothetical protein
LTSGPARATTATIFASGAARVTMTMTRTPEWHAQVLVLLLCVSYIATWSTAVQCTCISEKSDYSYEESGSRRQHHTEVVSVLLPFSTCVVSSMYSSYNAHPKTTAMAQAAAAAAATAVCSSSSCTALRLGLLQKRHTRLAARLLCCAVRPRLADYEKKNKRLNRVWPAPRYRAAR